MLETCTICGKKTHGLTMVDEETWVCEDCLEENYFQCDECLEYWSYDYVEFFHLKNGKTICENCREDHDDKEIKEE